MMSKIYHANPTGYEDTKEKSRHERDLEPKFLKKTNHSLIHHKILDFGCGAGKELVKYLVPIAEERNVPILGIDISDAMISFAGQNSCHPKVSYMVADILDPKLKIENASFDLITSRLVLHLIPEWRKVLERLNLLLINGGQLAVTLATDRRMFKLYRHLAEHEVFKKYMKDLPVMEWVDMEKCSAEKMYSNYLIENGWNINWIETHYQDRAKNIPLEDHTRFYMSVNPYLNQVPEENLPDLTKIYQKEVEELLEGEKNNDSFECLSFVAQKFK